MIEFEIVPIELTDTEREFLACLREIDVLICGFASDMGIRVDDAEEDRE